MCALESAGGIAVQEEGEPEWVGEGGVHAAYMEGKGRESKRMVGWKGRAGLAVLPVCVQPQNPAQRWSLRV